jgi:hypothetical protein
MDRRLFLSVQSEQFYLAECRLLHLVLQFLQFFELWILSRATGSLLKYIPQFSLKSDNFSFGTPQYPKICSISSHDTVTISGLSFFCAFFHADGRLNFCSVIFNAFRNNAFINVIHHLFRSNLIFARTYRNTFDDVPVCE